MANARGIDAYRDFHGEDPRHIVTIALPDEPQTGYRLGRVEAIAYRAKRYGKYDSYIHEFRTKAGPDLDVSSDGQQLYLTGGQYEVTDHGIEDRDMPAFLVANPSKPKRTKKMAATKRNSKGQFVKSKTRRKPNPAPAKVARASPRSHKRRPNPAPAVIRETSRRSVRPKRRTSNPKSFLGIDPLQLLLSGSSQAVGAVATSVAFAYLPLPAIYKTGATGALAKIATGIAIGSIISKMGKGQRNVQEFAQNFASGTFVLAAVEWLKQAIPTTINMGLIEYPDGSMGYLTSSSVVDDVGGVTMLDDMSGVTIDDMSGVTIDDMSGGEVYPISYGGPNQLYQGF